MDRCYSLSFLVGQSGADVLNVFRGGLVIGRFSDREIDAIESVLSNESALRLIFRFVSAIRMFLWRGIRF